MADSTEKKKATGKIAKEVAEDDFDRFCKGWFLDIREDELDEEELDGFKQQRRRLIDSIRSGHLRVDPDGKVLEYDLLEPFGSYKTLKIKCPRGDAILAFDGPKEGKNMHKLNAFMGAMCGEPYVIFGETMHGADVKVFQAVATLFFAG